MSVCVSSMCVCVSRNMKWCFPSEQQELVFNQPLHQLPSLWLQKLIRGKLQDESKWSVMSLKPEMDGGSWITNWFWGVGHMLLMLQSIILSSGWAPCEAAMISVIMTLILKYSPLYWFILSTSSQFVVTIEASSTSEKPSHYPQVLHLHWTISHLMIYTQCQYSILMCALNVVRRKWGYKG